MSKPTPISAQVAFLPEGSEQRQTRRRAVNFAAVVEMEGVSIEAVQLRDISERGCRIDIGGKAVPGAVLLVKLPGLEAVRAKIVWSADDQAGCGFEDELHPASLELLTRIEATPSRQAPAKRSVFGLRLSGGT